MNTSRAKMVVGLFTLALGAAWACSSVAGHSSETNWFDSCNVDGDCSVGRCLCGVCTESCNEDSNCPGSYICAGDGSGAFTRLCKGAESAPAGVCLNGCGGGHACAAGFECESDACVPRGQSGPPVGEQTMSAYTWSRMMQIVGDDSQGLLGQCLPRSFPVDSEGHVPCAVVALRGGSTDCRCDGAGFAVPAAETLRAAKNRMRQSGECDAAGKPSCDGLCGCELVQKTGSDLETCRQQDGALSNGPGWCYIDPGQAGNPTLVENCPATQRRALRVGGVPDQTLLLACTSMTATSPQGGATPGKMGDPCIPQDEFSPNFSGFVETEVNVESGSPSCSTGICLAAHFRGRVSCTYGQRPGQTIDGVPTVDPTLGADERCYLPGTSHEPANAVNVPVSGQLLTRSPERSVYCSCRCDGPAGEGPFCACPSGFECAPLVDSYGTAWNAQFTGSYCIKSGTDVPNPTNLDTEPDCNSAGGRGPRPAGCGDP